jgi:predicted ATPase/DNA-binding XRE family transcriptional regulator
VARRSVARNGFADHLRQLRLRAGLSQEALAERAGVSVATIGAIEEGQRRRPYPNTLRALADSLGLTATEREALLSLQDDNAPPSEVAALALPLPPTPLVGRESEIAEATALLSATAQAVRLVTLIGPGGVGKTRLALAIADRLRDTFADGVVFVDLAPIREHRLVPATIARALGIRESSGHTSRELLIAHLRPRHLLLTLDNFEHLLGATPLLTELVAACPRLRLLVTSRSALRVRSERRLVVPPLAVPRAADVQDPAAIATYPAVHLFVDRLQSLTPEFNLDSENAPVVAEICRKLDGVPLALELAAARAQLFTPRVLLNRLGHRLKVLRGGPVDLPERQRTLADTIGWSYELLEPAEQAVFRRLSVFAGGWTLEATEAVCSGVDVPVDDVLQRVAVLLDSSLIRRLDQTADEPRFGMLETVREYGLDQLQANGEEVDVRNRHLAFYAAMVDAMQPNLHGGHREASADRVEREIDNLRAAIAWSTHSDPALGLRLVSTLRFFWYMCGHQREASDYLQAALVAPVATADVATRGRGLATLGYMLTLQGQYVAARSALEAALNIGRDLADTADVAFALRYLGLIASTEGDYAAATEFLEESLTRYRRMGADADVGLLLSYLGDVAIHLRDFDRAQLLFEESSALLARIRYTMGLPWPLRRQAHIARLRGDPRRAVKLCIEALALNREIGEWQGVAASLVALAQVAEAQSQPELGVEFLGKAEAVVGPTDLQLMPFDRHQHEVITAQLRAQLDQPAWDVARAAGRRRSLDEAVEAALALG